MALQFPGNEVKKELNALSSLVLDLSTNDRFESGCNDLNRFHGQLKALLTRPFCRY